jgi:hypothetical protein
MSAIVWQARFSFPSQVASCLKLYGRKTNDFSHILQFNTKKRIHFDVNWFLLLNK